MRSPIDPVFKASLRLRLALWYVAFTLVGMSLYGAALSQYLKHELRASREENMLQREHRFLNFVATDMLANPARNLSQVIAHFSQASPDSDVIEVLNMSGKRLYPRVNPTVLPADATRVSADLSTCSHPCLTTFDQAGHHWRLLTHSTLIAGQPRLLLMAGSTDEHYDILNSVRSGYFLLLPMILLGSVMGGYALSRTALNPVGRLTERARTISLTSLDGRLPVPNTGDELQSLAEAWNDVLMRLETEVERSNRLTMDVSHDLRSAMTVILANAELSLRRNRTPEQYRTTMTAIQQESAHVLTMLEDMLLVATSGDINRNLQRKPVCFSEVVTEVFESSRASAVIKDQDFSLTLPQPEAKIWLTGDHSLLRRLVSILVDNALKYTPPSGKIQLSLAQSGHTVSFSVTDNGIGIPPHLQSRVFDRSFRADAARSRKDIPGSGLGLSIAQWIASVHHFRLTLVSSVNKGSTFTLSAPTDGWPLT